MLDSSYCVWVCFTGPMPAVQGGSITKGLPGTRIHQESSITYRGGSITQVCVRMREIYMFTFSFIR